MHVFSVIGGFRVWHEAFIRYIPTQRRGCERCSQRGICWKFFSIKGVFHSGRAPRVKRQKWPWGGPVVPPPPSHCRVSVWQQLRSSSLWLHLHRSLHQWIDSSEFQQTKHPVWEIMFWLSLTPQRHLQGPKKLRPTYWVFRLQRLRLWSCDQDFPVSHMVTAGWYLCFSKQAPPPCTSWAESDLQLVSLFLLTRSSATWNI